MLSPLFIHDVLYGLYGNLKFGPQQWTSLILSNSGAQPTYLALITGLMAIGRYFGGEMVHKLDQTGVLLGSAVMTTIGVYLLSTSTGSMVYVAAITFAIGVCYFWPNMIGFVAEDTSLWSIRYVNGRGCGMFSTAIFNLSLEDGLTLQESLSRPMV